MVDTPQLGVQAVFDDQEFNRRMDGHLRRLSELEQRLNDVANASEQSDDRRGRSASAAQSTITRELRTLRWEMVSIMFFMRIFGAAFQEAFALMEEGAQKAAERMGIRALARTLETDLGGVADHVRAVNDEVMSVSESYNIVLQGMLKDQGQFSDEYARLWEAARVAAVTGMTDADTAFQAFVQDLVEGTGAATDAINPIYGLSRALEEYAANTGRTVEELSQMEAAHVQLRQIYDVTTRLMNEGADRALEAQASYARLQSAWDDLRAVGGELVRDSGVLDRMTEMLRTVAQIATMTAASFGAVVEEMGEFFNLARLLDPSFWVQMGGQLGAAARGDPSDAFTRRMQGYAESMGMFRDEVDKTRMDYERYRERAGAEEIDLGPIVDHLMRREEIIEEHQRRVERIERKYQDRVQTINLRYARQVTDIQRSAQMDRERAVRNFHRRESQLAAQHAARMARMQQEHHLRLEQNRREYEMKSLHSEALYQYERGLLVAYGDVLAIEDLDARYALEKDARKDNFNEQQRQERENYDLRRQAAQEQFEMQMASLRQALQDQLEEIDLREQERLRQAAEKREEDLQKAKEDRQKQLEEEALNHKRSLEQWSEYWVKLAKRFELGLQDIEAILRSFFGEGGEVDNIMNTFMAKWDSYMAKLNQLKAALGSLQRGVAYGGGATGGSQWRRGGDYPFQYGGMGIFSKPTSLLVGESGPEMVSVRPLSSIGGLSLSWAGGPVPIAGSGLEGMDTSGLGDAITQGILVALERGLTRSGATYA